MRYLLYVSWWIAKRAVWAWQDFLNLVRDDPPFAISLAIILFMVLVLHGCM